MCICEIPALCVFLVQSVDIPLLCHLFDGVASMLLQLWCVVCIFIAIYNIGINGKFGGTVREGRL